MIHQEYQIVWIRQYMHHDWLQLTWSNGEFITLIGLILVEHSAFPDNSVLILKIIVCEQKHVVN